VESNGEYCEEVYVRQNSGIDNFQCLKGVSFGNTGLTP